MFLVEGTRGIREAFSAGALVESVFVQPSMSSAPDLIGLARIHSKQVLEVSDQVMRAISDATTPPGALAIAGFIDKDPGKLLDDAFSFGLVLAGVRDPGNLGTILRAAWAAGVEAVFLSRGTVDVYNPKVVRAAAGALFNLALARDVELPWLMSGLGDRRILRIAADPRGPTSYYELDLTGRCALVFGGEAAGIPEEVVSNVDVRASIPMPGGADSLNVALAAGLFLFEAARQRQR